MYRQRLYGNNSRRLTFKGILKYPGQIGLVQIKTGVHCPSLFLIITYFSKVKALHSSAFKELSLTMGEMDNSV